MIMMMKVVIVRNFNFVVETADKKFITSHICMAMITIKNNFILTYLLHVDEEQEERTEG